MSRSRRLSKPLLIVAASMTLGIGLDTPTSAQCSGLGECELVWSDEFDGTAIDESKWEIQIGTGTQYGLSSGWGNGELQSYQAANATVADGFLTITARREAASGSEYTSARLRTLGRAQWTFGRMEMRAKMPIGQGLWPAFWMLPSNPRYGTWAASGEIDIMEYLGHEPSRVLGTIQYGDSWPRNSFSGTPYDLANGTFHEDFHTFAVEWEPGEIRWYVDGRLYSTRREWFSTGGPFPAPFDIDFHLLLNVAVGGNLPGSPDSTTSFPQEMVVDYVRVYQSKPAKGTQVSTASLLPDKALRMKKIRAKLTISLTNQARKGDSRDAGRRLSCAVRTQGNKGALTPKGTVELTLHGVRAGSAWSGRAVTEKIAAGRVDFAPQDIKALVDEANGGGATVERMVVEYRGAGGKKVIRTELDCWQRAS